MDHTVTEALTSVITSMNMQAMTVTTAGRFLIFFSSVNFLMVFDYSLSIAEQLSIQGGTISFLQALFTT